MQAFEDSYKAWADSNLPPTIALPTRIVPAILSFWFDRHPLKALPFRINPEYVEIGFAYPLDDAGEFCVLRAHGRLASSTELEGLWVVENKFPGRVNATWIKQWRTASQLTGSSGLRSSM